MRFKPSISLALLLLLTVFFTSGCKILKNNPVAPGVITIYWKNGSEWRSGGGLGTITIKDNLRYVGSVTNEFIPPADGVENYCFAGIDNNGGESVICISISDCQFFVTNEKDDETLVFASEDCTDAPEGPDDVTD